MVFDNIYDLTFSGFSLLNQPFQEIEVNDRELGGGGFGKVYDVIELDRYALTVPLILKRFTGPVEQQQKCFQTIVTLQKRLYDYVESHYKHPDDFFEYYPGLQAIPLCSFRATLDGEDVWACCCLNLNCAGFTDFDKFFEGTDDSEQLQNEYLGKPAEERLLTSYQLISALNFLKQELRFQHADIKAESVWINSGKNIAALIDFDGGVAYDRFTLWPNTFGTPDQPWFAPELKRNANTPDQERKYTISWESDYWSATIGIYYLLVLCHPFEFLSNHSLNVYKDYFRRFKWPDADYPDQRDLVSYQKQSLNELHGSVAAHFRQTFNEGYEKKAKRIDFYRWQLALKQALAESYLPIIQASFPTEAVLQNEPITLTWYTNRATYLQVNGNDVGLSGTQTFHFLANGKVLLRARNEFTYSEHRAEIRVIPRPIIQSFAADAVKVKQGQLVTLRWQVQHAGNVQLFVGSKQIEATNINEYSFTAEESVSLHLIVDAELKLTSVEGNIDIIVIPPVIIDQFEVSPNYLIQTKPVKISWAVRNAMTIRLEPEGLELSSEGKREDYPNENPKVYRLIATNELFEEEQTITVNVFLVQVPPIKLPIPPILPPYGRNHKLPQSPRISPTLHQIQQRVDIELDALLSLISEPVPPRTSRWYKQFIDQIRR